MGKERLPPAMRRRETSQFHGSAVRDDRGLDSWISKKNNSAGKKRVSRGERIQTRVLAVGL